VSAPRAYREHGRIIESVSCLELAMLRDLIDLLWWLADRAWGFARAWTGDDVYDRYLAEHHRIAPDAPVLARAEFFARHLDEKWHRYVACGRSADRS